MNKNHWDKEISERIKLKKKLTSGQIKLSREISSWQGDMNRVGHLSSHVYIITRTSKERKKLGRELCEEEEKIIKKFTKILKKYNATLADIKKVMTKHEWNMLSVPKEYREEKKKLG